jgi:hypothetical protein
MKPLNVSYSANIAGTFGGLNYGWIVFASVGPIERGEHMLDLVRAVEKEKGFAEGSVAILNFRRMEEPEA